MVKVNSTNPLGTGGNQAKGSKYISILLKFHLFMSSCDLENEVMVTQISSALKLVLMVQLCKFEENPSTGSRDILRYKTMTLKMGSKSPNP